MKRLLNILLLCTIIPGLSAQINVSLDMEEGYREIPQEKVYVHYNNSLLFTGEYIYFKVYTIQAVNMRMSSLSKIAYVELLGEDGTSIFRHKVRLEEGSGQGDFFIPTIVPSGNYKLLGYTQWMLNGGENNIFRGDVAILNPYQGDQAAVTPQVDSDVLNSELIVSNQGSQTPVTSSDLKLEVSKKNFSTRERVVLKLSGNPVAVDGKYSVSVRKLESILQPEMLMATTLNQLYSGNSGNEATKVYLPELRGELLWGRIEPVGNIGSISVHNVKIGLSLPGEDFVVKVAETNTRGEFFFNISEEYSAGAALLEVVGANKEQYQIRLSENVQIDHRRLNFNKFHISREMEEMILERSVYNQIENAYYGVKPDTLLRDTAHKAFYEKPTLTYNLDDFTRFPSLRETFIEIVGEAYVRNVGGQPTVRVRMLENASDAGELPLILVDGVMVQDHVTFLNIPAGRIQSIGVIKDNYYLGTHMFQGILDVQTIAGNFQEQFSAENVLNVELEKPKAIKRYFKQHYSKDTNENIPDFRYQLLWQPHLEFDGNATELYFYTSDLTGNFEISVEGFTETGNPVSLKEVIRVEN